MKNTLREKVEHELIVLAGDIREDNGEGDFDGTVNKILSLLSKEILKGMPIEEGFIEHDDETVDTVQENLRTEIRNKIISEVKDYIRGVLK